MDTNGFPDIFDRKIHDKTRTFCSNERIDEDHFRYCISQRIREANRMTGKLPRIIALFSRIGKRGCSGFISFRKALSGPLLIHGRNHRSGRKEAKIPAGMKL